jgi:ABC-2 type transport system ATP-binding protein
VRLGRGRGTLRRVGLCPQEIALYRELDAVENLDFFARMNGLAPPLRRHRIAQLVDLFGLAPYRGVPVGRLSGGWQRRVNVAVALVHGPEVLVLDEPTAALDVAARQALWEALGALERDGLAVLLTSHHLDEVQRACSRVGILRAGRIAAEGSIAQLLARVPAQAVATLAGSDAATVRRRAAALGWPVRAWGGALACLLPRALSLREVVEAFEGVPVSSVAVQPVTLEHAYLEVLGAGEPDTAPAAAGPADA